MPTMHPMSAAQRTSENPIAQSAPRKKRALSLISCSTGMRGAMDSVMSGAGEEFTVKSAFRSGVSVCEQMVGGYG